MKKLNVKFAILALFSAMFLALTLCINTAKAKEIKVQGDANSCLVSKDGITFKGEVCYFNPNEENSYQSKTKEVNFTLEISKDIYDELASQETSITYKDITKTKNVYVNVYASSFKDLDHDQIYSAKLTIPVKTNEEKVQWVEVNVKRTGTDIYTLYLAVRPDTTAPEIAISCNLEDCDGWNTKLDHLVSVNNNVNSTADGSKFDKMYYLWSKEDLSDPANKAWKNAKVFTPSEDWNGSSKFVSDNLENSGEYKLWVKALDVVGNYTIASSEVVKIDVSAPVINWSYDGNSTDYKAMHNVNITINEEHSGVKSIKYAWRTNQQTWENSEIKWISIDPNETNFNILTPSVSGSYFFKVIVVDNCGNESILMPDNRFNVSEAAVGVDVSVLGDVTKPTQKLTTMVKISKNDMATIKEIYVAWFKSNEERLELSYPIDTTLEGSKMYLWKTTNELTSYDKEEYVFQFESSFLGDGDYYYSVMVVYQDGTNKVFTQFDNLYTIDVTGPEIQFVETTTGVKNYHETKVLVSDLNGVVSELKYLWVAEADSLEVTEEALKESGKSASVDSLISASNLSGAYKLWVLATDMAGNETLRSLEFTFDSQLPTITLDNLTALYKKGYEIKFTSSKELEKVEYAWYLVSENPETIEYSNQENKIYFDADVDGEYKLYLRLTDTAGNVNEFVYEESFVLDNTIPVITGLDEFAYYNGKVEITVEDVNLKSIKLNGEELVTEGSEEFKYVISVEEAGYYHLEVVDAADNRIDNYFVLNLTDKTVIDEENVNVERQLYLPILLDSNNKYYVRIPSGNYPKTNVLIFTRLNEGTLVTLNQSDASLLIDDDLNSKLSRRSEVFYITDENAISATANADGSYGYVIVNLVSSNQARDLGINTTIIDNKSVALLAGTIGTISLIAIFLVYRGKRTLAI